MREVEVKASVENKTKLLAQLKSSGVRLSEPIVQQDRVYKRPQDKPTDKGVNFLRIRSVTGQPVEFTLKQTVSDLDKIEHEITVNDGETMAQIIDQLGFKLYTNLTKQRQQVRLNDITICVDEVEGLGTFIEAEKVCPDDVDGQAVKEELWQLLESYGVKAEAEVKVGYDVLMVEKLGASSVTKPEIDCTLVFLKRGDELLLGYKKRGFGKNKWNGFGGKVEREETIEQALVREIREEINVVVMNYQKVGHIIFDQMFNGRPSVIHGHIYICEEWQGEPSETDEMKPQWFNTSQLPYEEMWSDDRHWLPQVLAGESIKAKFVYDSDNQLIDYSVEIVDTDEL